MERRLFLKNSTVILATPFVWIPNIHALAQGTREEELIRSEQAIAHNAAMQRHLSRIQQNTSEEGISSQSFALSQNVMAGTGNGGFSDTSRSPVYGVDGHAMYGQSRSQDTNRCNAFLVRGSNNTGCCDNTMRRLKGSECVTLLEGPSIIALGRVTRDLNKVFKQSMTETVAKKQVKEHCLPRFAGTRALVTFESINEEKNTDLISCGRANIGVTYKFLNSTRSVAEAVYTVFSRETEQLIWEGNFQYGTG